MSSSRQLAAIMFADIAGFTAIMQEDEDTALQLRQKFQKKLEEVVATHQGRVLDLRGDGALCNFTSTIEAVRAAVALQVAMRSDPLVPLRIGMHTGDVVADGNSIYGDGVNLLLRGNSLAHRFRQVQ